MVTKVKDIKAEVITKWNKSSHPGCKFYPGAFVAVDQIPDHERKTIKDREGNIGVVVAVTCGRDGKIRGKTNNGWCNRQFTRYYLQFEDGRILGFHSHNLTKTFFQEYPFWSSCKANL